MTKRWQKILWFSGLGLLLIFASYSAQAAYTWEVNPPAAPGGALPGETLDTFVKYVYYWLLGLGGFFAFIRLSYAGILWAGAGGNITKTSQALDTIKNVIFGLVLLLFSWLILNTINPQILSPELSQVKPQTLAQATDSGGLSLDALFQSLTIKDVQPDIFKTISFNTYGTVPLPRLTRQVGEEPGSGPNPPGPGGSCNAITQPMTPAQAGLDCRDVSWGVCNTCNKAWPVALLQDLCSLKQAGVDFYFNPGMTGYSHREGRAVDIYVNGSVSQAISILAAKKSQCGQELFAPDEGGNSCYCTEYCGYDTLPCSCTTPTACGSCGFANACTHNTHIHYAVKRSCVDFVGVDQCSL